MRANFISVVALALFDTMSPDVYAVVLAGRVNVAGEDWAARSTEAINAGTKIRVIGADGIVLEVTHS